MSLPEKEKHDTPGPASGARAQGASAYLGRMFKTLAVFAVLAFGPVAGIIAIRRLVHRRVVETQARS